LGAYIFGDLPRHKIIPRRRHAIVRVGAGPIHALIARLHDVDLMSEHAADVTRGRLRGLSAAATSMLEPSSGQECRLSRLYLLRHAKAGWAQPGMRDFDRPLDATGRADAEATGQAMREHAYVPDVTLCSNAKRARQTLEGIAGSADTGRVIFLDHLYSEDAAGYLQLVREHGRHGSLLVIGHNPMMEDLALALSERGEPAALAMLGLGFPTSGLAVIRFDASLSGVTPGKGFLEAFLTPAGS
jgi:phosphohistidine phosphatase